MEDQKNNLDKAIVVPNAEALRLLSNVNSD